MAVTLTEQPRLDIWNCRTLTSH